MFYTVKLNARGQQQSNPTKGKRCNQAGDNEGFLIRCDEATVWNFVGDRILSGKEAVRQYMASVYQEPPRFDVSTLIAEGDYVAALGKITLKEPNGTYAHYSYCDVWRFANRKIIELQALSSRC